MTSLLELLHLWVRCTYLCRLLWMCIVPFIYGIKVYQRPLKRFGLLFRPVLSFYKKKSVRALLLCPSRYLRPWNCPIKSDGQSRCLTRMILMLTYRICSRIFGCHHSFLAMSNYSCSHLGLYMKFSRFQIAKKERWVRFLKKSYIWNQCLRRQTSSSLCTWWQI